MRATLRQLGFAAVWIGTAGDPAFELDASAAPRLDALLEAFASTSGYRELGVAPVVALGHADASAWPWLYARARPERTLAVLSLSGEWPYGDTRPGPEQIDPALNGIPGLVSIGEYEWAEERATFGLAQRAVHPGIPLTFLGEAGGGRFEHSSEKTGYIARYLSQAAAARLPADAGGPYLTAPTLVYIDPLAGGWLADRWRGREPARVPAAPVEEYAEPDEAFWCFDREHAIATEKFRQRERDLRVALLGFNQDGTLVPQRPGTPEQVAIPFRPREDGVTFELGGEFLATVPRGRPERWMGLPANATIGRPETGGLIELLALGGPVEERAPGTFAVAFDRGAEAGAAAEIWLLARHPGDAHFKTALQQAVLRLPAQNDAGRPQQITFPVLPDVTARATPIALTAHTDSGLPVRYYVREGPAEIVGNTLRLTPIPSRARLPLRVTVVAWQYGRITAPAVQSAAPVARTFLVTR